MTMLSTFQFSPMRPFGRKGAIHFLSRPRRLINVWAAAAAIAWRERRGALAALRQLDEHELKDIGIYCGQIDDVIERAGHDAAALMVLDP